MAAADQGAESRAVETPRVGQLLEVPDPAEVTLPTGEVRIVTGGLYFVEHHGEHRVEKA